MRLGSGDKTKTESDVLAPRAQRQRHDGNNQHLSRSVVSTSINAGLGAVGPGRGAARSVNMRRAGFPGKAHSSGDLPESKQRQVR